MYLKPAITYLLLFALLLSGCYTTEFQTELPENISNGKSEVTEGEDYELKTVLLKTGEVLSMEGFSYKFKADSTNKIGKLLYRTLIPVYDTVRYADKSYKYVMRKPVSDSINLSSIKLLNFEKQSFNNNSYLLFLLIPVGVVLMYIFLLGSFFFSFSGGH